MAINDYYVAASSGNDTTGDGSSGTPWKTFIKALQTITQDAVNGDRIYLSGTDTLAASPDISGDYGTPSDTAPLVIDNWPTGDTPPDGDGVLDGDATYDVIVGDVPNLWILNLRLTNAGTNQILIPGLDSVIVNCQLDTCSNTTPCKAPGSGTFANCYIHTMSGAYCLTGDNQSQIIGNYIDGTSATTRAIYAAGSNMRIARNIVYVDGAVDGIDALADQGLIEHNSILSNGGTGAGIQIPSARTSWILRNNLVEGFIGVGGMGIDQASNAEPYLMHNNACYNNTTNYANAGEVIAMVTQDNEALGASPFAKSGALSYANRFTYFAPADVGNVQGGAYPTGARLDKGAVQHADPAAGGGGTAIIGGTILRG